MENKIVYQIYPKSFNDSRGRGEGDIQGIIQRLDYLALLGVDVLWLTPVFRSPHVDNGYDVSDYYHVDPRFGTDADLQALIDQARLRGMDIMLDMVFNHSSTEHPWFQKALQGDVDFMNRYIFVDNPVNWQSKFGGSAFEYVKELDKYYLHLFDKTQADLNWENPIVFDEFVKICRYWLDKGVRGFRFDVINLISKPDVFEDDHQGDGRRLYTDGPNVSQYLRKLGAKSFALVDDVMTVGELSSTSIEKASQYSKKSESGLSTVFNFHHLKVDYKDGNKWALKPFDFLELKHLYADWQKGMIENDASMSLFLNNHDQPRAISRFTNESFEGATMLASMIFTLKGVVYIYQGEEIGLPNAYFDSIRDYQDIESLNYYKILLKDHSEKEVLKILQERSRDNGRTPIPWNDDIHYGFSNAEPWLGFSKAKTLWTVEDALADKESIFYFYKNLIAIRKSDPILIDGDIEFIDLDHPNLFIYTRADQYLCIHNFYDKVVDYELKEDYHDVVINNYSDFKIKKDLKLRPYESVVLKKVI
ncbi:alpha,alpha-phosphotrehalase [Erysipelothrix urinaevulpis]|uniref:alpha,alpha-phosphotrehalase n=1 Tax=Erysipelothrix urinaevulpis TaxID=2683717 RepID=UPI00135B84EB|nr:alpha,alpha-phosphotrehalase [Erysipelothrix urinaevulpis]